MQNTEKVIEEIAESNKSKESRQNIKIEMSSQKEAEVEKCNIYENKTYIVNSTELYNVALFIDYENVYKNLLKTESNPIRDGFFEKIRRWCKDRNRRLVKIAVYCNYDNEDLHESFHQSLLQAYGVETIHTSNQGKNYADLQITIDVLNAMHINDNIDEFIIMSNDKDMTPLLNSIRYNKKKVSIITTGDEYNQTICSFADEQIKYEDVIALSIESDMINKIEQKIGFNIINFAEKNYNKYLEEKKAGLANVKYQHIEYEFYLSSVMRNSCIMRYEACNCLRHIYDENKIFFYTYNHRGRDFIGISSVARRNDLILAGLIKTSDVVDFDFDKAISALYLKYQSKKDA